MSNLVRCVCLIFTFGLGLSACGGDDSGSAPAQQAAAPAESAAPAASAPASAAPAESGGFDLNSIERAEGVVYQDEIYANWPYN